VGFFFKVLKMKQKINKHPNDANMLLSVRFAGALANEGLASSPRSLLSSKLTDNVSRVCDVVKI
jgi:hypothetical protein